MLARLTTRTARALLSPSARVLVASSAPDSGVAVASELPWSDVHWPTLVSLTSFERAEAQVFRLLRAAPDGAVPDDVTKAMQGIYRVAVFRGAELADAAAVACDALTSAGIPALWLKGAALAMQSAEGFALRSMGDLDVLVRPEERDRAREVLRAAGWRDAVTDGGYMGHHHDAPMVWRGGIRLELHTGLFPPGHPFAPDPAEAWFGRAASVAWGDRTVLVLPPAWHLVHASVHWAWNHEGAVGSWQYLHDVHRVTAGWSYRLERWRAFEAAARQIGAERPVGWALWTARLLGEAITAESVEASLRGAGGLLVGVTEREWVLRSFHSPAASPSVTWSRFWWRQAMGGLGDVGQEWPWSLGRAAQPVDAGTADHAARVPGPGAAARWRRHLARVLGG